MRKKLLVFMLLVVTVIVLAVPTPALAWGGWRTQTPFVATAQVYVSDPGEVHPQQIGRSYIYVNTIGEQVSGTILSSNGWPAIQNFNILFDHQSRTFINLNTMKITGTATGSVTVFDLDGAPVMQGSYSAFIRGDVSLDPLSGQIIYTKIYDSASFSLAGVPGTDFASISANGFGFANLDWDWNYGTLVGPMILSGTYR